MDKSRVALMLKKKRSLSGLSVQDVVSRLKDKGFTLNEKTLYGYENGVSTPNVPLFIALCDIYQIDDIIYEVSGTPTKTKLTVAKASSEEWSVDLYNDFFRASLFEKINLLVMWGVPSFSGYEDQLSDLFPPSAEKANFDFLYNAFMKLNEIGQSVVMRHIVEVSQDIAYLKSTKIAARNFSEGPINVSEGLSLKKDAVPSEPNKDY